MTSLPEYLRGWCGVPFQWGRTDCQPFVFGWCDARRSMGLRETVVGRYTDARSMIEHYGTNGAFETGFADRMAWATPVDAPAVGHVALVRLGRRPAVGLVTANCRIALRTAQGIGLAGRDDAVLVQAWAV